MEGIKETKGSRITERLKKEGIDNIRVIELSPSVILFSGESKDWVESLLIMIRILQIFNATLLNIFNNEEIWYLKVLMKK